MVVNAKPHRPTLLLFSILYSMNKEEAINLLSQHDNSTKLFSLAGLKTWCRVVQIYDLDTIQVVFPFTKDDVHKIVVRVNGVDSPEMTSKDKTVQAWAVKARNRMLSLIVPGVFEVDGSYTKKDIVRLLKENVSIIWLHALDFDKFGRLLGDLYQTPDDKETIQSTCIQEGYCKAYFGKTKSQWVPEDCK
jgi:endonuclease YncB( thermonuclease family)